MDLLPKVDIPVVTVKTIWTGANPEEIESQVTKEIEDAVATLVVSKVSSLVHLIVPQLLPLDLSLGLIPILLTLM